MRWALLVIVSFVAETSASALTYYPNAVRVRITGTNGGAIQLAEVMVTDANAVNVAAAVNGGWASAFNAFDAASAAANAVDGHTGGVASTGIYRSAGTPEDYLDVMLDHSIILSSITLYGRSDADTAANLYDIAVFDSRGRSLFATRVDARSGPKTTWFDVNGTPVEPGPLPVQLLPGGIGAVPEPASWSLMIAGFGLIGAERRRRLASA